MTAPQNLQLLNDFLAAYNAHDADHAASFYTEDAVIEVEGVAPHVEGRSAIAGMFRSRFSGEMPDIRGEVLDAVAEGDRIFSSLRYTGTVKGGISAGFGDSAVALAAGKKMVNRCLDRMTIRDGKIAREYAVINMEAMRRQLATAEPPPAPMSEEENAQTVRRFYEACNSGDVAELSALLSPRLVIERNGLPSEIEDSAAWIAGFLREMRATFPDLRWTLLDLFAHGDRVTARATAAGTGKGEWRSPWGVTFPPTGKSTGWTEIVVYRIEGSKIAQWWSAFDLVTTLLQAGILPGKTVV